MDLGLEEGKFAVEVARDLDLTETAFRKGWSRPVRTRTNVSRERSPVWSARSLPGCILGPESLSRACAEGGDEQNDGDRTVAVEKRGRDNLRAASESLRRATKSRVPSNC
ncbi:hypothetical protein MVI01_73800 [Myxococcus virescens]|uniref:Uncharacterized protein n=1 Tax=Myxococcus virescens TaxID=83456 RepID=A0A511HPT6_9BACT|nr:hypothetical protein MVI01_73800 [Myxococcus virescens]